MTKDKKMNLMFIFLFIGMGCILSGGALVVFCGVDTVSSTHSFHLPYRSGTIFVRPWIGWTIIALAIVAALNYFIFMIGFALTGKGENDEAAMKCPFCGKKKAGWTPGKYKCKNCGEKFIIEPERSD